MAHIQGRFGLQHNRRRRPEVVSRWAAWAGELRGRDETFRRAYEEVDAALAGAASAPQ
ncbi:MAG: hypothetical protein V1750_03440 [Acidobacteriota bacterium]